MGDAISLWRRAAGWLALALSAPAIAAFASDAAAAQDYTSRDVGGWTVAASSDKQGCFLTRQFAGPGETTLLLGLDHDGANHLSVLNANWSIAPKDRLTLDFRLSTGAYTKHFAIGIASDGKKGFVTNFEAKFPTYFAASAYLHIDRGTVPVARMSLAGSGAAVAELRRCVALQQGTAAGTGETPRVGDVPNDPFAPELKRKSKK